MKRYTAPRPDLKAVVSVGPHRSENVVLTSKKPFVVLVTVIVAEGRDNGSGVEPIEKQTHGIQVFDEEHSQHEFDSLDQAIAFVASQYNPDGNPVKTKVFEFKDGSWEAVRNV